MKHEIYKERNSTDDFNVVDFLSKGQSRTIPKRITFIKTELENIYNLAFGDIEENGEINDSVISDNGDRDKILATIAVVIDDYTFRYPERWILFRGSTNERTRLYRMAISANLEELSMKFDIYSFEGGELIRFTKNMNINTFLIKRKKV